MPPKHTVNVLFKRHLYYYRDHFLGALIKQCIQETDFFNTGTTFWVRLRSPKLKWILEDVPPGQEMIPVPEQVIARAL